MVEWFERVEYSMDVEGFRREFSEEAGAQDWRRPLAEPRTFAIGRRGTRWRAAR
jgi:hypothetical protein